MKRLYGLYAISHSQLIPDDDFAAAIEQALIGGARIIQYRDKSNDHSRRLQQALEMTQLCHRYDAVSIINDDIELALSVDADGVHIGMDDIPLHQARRLLGSNKLIGVSCYNRFELAHQAHDEGADYIAFGSFFPSSVKPDAPRAQPELLHRAKQELDIPVCAIGGINSSNAMQLITAGTDMLAVISEVFDSEDIAAASRRLSQLFS